jgi:hypothetical protein
VIGKEELLNRIIKALEALPERELLTTTNLSSLVRTSPGNYVFGTNELMPYRYNPGPHRTVWGSKSTIDALKREISE